MSLGERLKQIRGKMTQEEFATTLGVTPLQISRIENNKSGMSLDLAVKISKTYGYSVDWISTGEDFKTVVEEPKIDYELQSKYMRLLEENNELQKKLNREQTKEIKDLQATNRG